MKLYYCDRRLGSRVDTFREPQTAPDTTPELEEELAVSWPEFWNPNLRGPDGQLISYNVQFSLIVYYVKMAVFRYGLSGAALRFFVSEKMAVILPAAGWKIAAGMFVWVGVVFLAFYILDPEVKRTVWEDNYGSRWLMRYGNRVWWAKWTGFFDYDMPIFEQLDEIGEIIAYEYRADVYPGMGPDIWDHFESWRELKRPSVLWNHYTWRKSWNIFQGFCTQVERGFYGVQKQYHDFMVPVSRW